MLYLRALRVIVAGTRINAVPGVAFGELGGLVRLKLLKISALVRISVRRIKIAMASACLWQYEFGLAHALLGAAV